MSQGNSEKIFKLLDCLLPNGQVVPLSCPSGITLTSLKTLLWQEAQKYPSSDKLGAASEYAIVAVTKDLRQQTLWNEDMLLSEVPLYSPIIKLVAPREPWQEGKINAQIESTVGRSMTELDECRDPEIQSFRCSALKVVADSVWCRELAGLESIALYHHPPLLDPSPTPPPAVTRHLDQGFLHIAIWVGDRRACSVRVSWNATPRGVTQAALDKLDLLKEDPHPTTEPPAAPPATTTGTVTDPTCAIITTKEGNKSTGKWFAMNKRVQNFVASIEAKTKRESGVSGQGTSDASHFSASKKARKTCEHSDQCNKSKEGTVDTTVDEKRNPLRYVLKICGTSEYLLAEEPVTQYKTIRQFVCRDKTPQLQLVSRGELYASLSPHNLVLPSYARTGVCWSQEYDLLTSRNREQRLSSRSAKERMSGSAEARRNDGTSVETRGKFESGLAMSTGMWKAEVSTNAGHSLAAESKDAQQHCTRNNIFGVKKGNNKRLIDNDFEVTSSKKPRLAFTREDKILERGSYPVSSDYNSVSDHYPELRNNEASSHTGNSKVPGKQTNSLYVAQSIEVTPSISSIDTDLPRLSNVSSSADFDSALHPSITAICGMLSKCCNYSDRHEVVCSSGRSSPSLMMARPDGNFTPSLTQLLHKPFTAALGMDSESTSSSVNGNVKSSASGGSCRYNKSKDNLSNLTKLEDGCGCVPKNLTECTNSSIPDTEPRSGSCAVASSINNGTSGGKGNCNPSAGTSSSSKREHSASVVNEEACCRCCSSAAASDRGCVNLWHPSLEGPLKVHVLAASHLVVKPGHKVFVCAGLYHGQDDLCRHTRTAIVPVTASSSMPVTKTLSAPTPVSGCKKNGALGAGSRGILSSLGINVTVGAANDATSNSINRDVSGANNNGNSTSSNVGLRTYNDDSVVISNKAIRWDCDYRGRQNYDDSDSNVKNGSDENIPSTLDDGLPPSLNSCATGKQGRAATMDGRARLRTTGNDTYSSYDAGVTGDLNKLAGKRSRFADSSRVLSDDGYHSYAAGEAALNQDVNGKSSSKAQATWSEWLEFDLNLQDCPRATKLCLSLVSASGKEDSPSSVLGCCTVPLFDWRGRLLQHSVALPLSPPPTHTITSSTVSSNEGCGVEEACLSLGGTGLVPPPSPSPFSGSAGGATTLLHPTLTSQCGGRGVLRVSLERRLGARPVLFPSLQQMVAYATTMDKITSRTRQAVQGHHQAAVSDGSGCYVSPSDEDLAFLCRVSELDPLVSLPRADQLRLWALRTHCHRVPAVLPRLLQAVTWASRDMVCQLYLLLSRWWSTGLPVSVCMEVLQPRYPDPVVRHTAVQALARGLSHHHLQQYLLQLCQCVLQETYLWSPLLHLLLHRALTNSTLGHYFLHHLRSSGVSRRVVAVLEAYCRGVCPSLLRDTTRQVAMMAALSDIGAALATKDDGGGSKDDSQQLQSELQTRLTSLQAVRSPLCPSRRLGTVKVSACAVLQSAKKPLRIVWHNPDPMAHLYANTYSVIFKRGDDLRQDELSLQVLGVMAGIWAEEGLHLRVTPYTCLAMHDNMGLIELVNNAKTVYSIQRRAKLGAIQVDSSQLYKWIKEHNRGPRLAQAIDTFTQSCAGYCVATFVLGIGDRHPDNIMVNEEGQIFHIDFGHFLGNFKKKFGLHRERVPFVLTQDFLRVIAGGAENPKDTPSFQKFEELCGQAYLALRRHSRLLLSLFALLLHSGLPELQSEADLAYLHRSLGVWCRSEEEALQFFRQQFLQASGGAWTTKLDWFFHSVKHR